MRGIPGRYLIPEIICAGSYVVGPVIPSHGAAVIAAPAGPFSW
jgi:hypothetical protein